VQVTPTACVLESNDTYTQDLNTYDSSCLCEERSEGSGEGLTGAGYTCYYEAGVQEEVASSAIWRTYIVLCELFMRFLPCLILTGLTIFMARDFHVSLRRRRKLMATVFTISGNTIFPPDFDRVATSNTERGKEKKVRFPL